MPQRDDASLQGAAVDGKAKWRTDGISMSIYGIFIVPDHLLTEDA